ncbi:MAG: TIGR04063 family PEP-CTERM/XrtA system glycosyltransferase [Pseudomonadota bacterium]
MRILHVFDHSLPLQSGYTFRSRAILREQRALGWKTVHVTSSKHYEAKAEFEEFDGLSFYRTAPGPFAKLPILNQWDVVQTLKARLRQILDQEQIDLIHVHSPCLNGMAAASVARERGLPWVYEMRALWEDAAVDHGTTRQGSLRYRAARALETWTLKRADAITCICEGLRRDIVSRGIAPDRVTVIPNAVDIDQFTWIDQRDEVLAAELGLQGKTVLGFLGSFYAYEGLDMVLDALAMLKDMYPDLRALLVGGGPQETVLKAQAQALGIADRVVFTGRVAHHHVNRYYSMVDVLVYARHRMRLTDLVTPLKPLEAMAQGKLVLASDVGGHKELIRDSETGFLFAADDVQALADAIERTLGARAIWPAILTQGRQFVEQERNWTRSIAGYEDAFAAAVRNSVKSR